MKNLLDIKNGFNFLKPGNGKRMATAAIIGLALLISAIHFATYNHEKVELLFLHTLLTKLYFVPVLLAAFAQGKRGAFVLSAIVTLTYLPHATFHLWVTLSSMFEGLSEIVLLWLVGWIAGSLSERLKRSQQEKSRLKALEGVSKMLSVINHDVVIDYDACVGLAKALERNHTNTNGVAVSARILLDRMEHLGAHLRNIQDLVLPQPLKKKRCSLIPIIKKSIESTGSSGGKVEIHYNLKGSMKPVYLDIKRIQFAFNNLLQSLVSTINDSGEIKITLQKKFREAMIDFDLDVKDLKTNSGQWNQFALFADPQRGYAFTLALSIIHSHGGKLEFVNKKKNSIRLSLPI